MNLLDAIKSGKRFRIGTRDTGQIWYQALSDDMHYAIKAIDMLSDDWIIEERQKKVEVTASMIRDACKIYRSTFLHGQSMESFFIQELGLDLNE